jgi:hypothetical protein
VFGSGSAKHLHSQEANDKTIFFLNQMGNNLDAYRAAIGLFHACKISLNIGYDSHSDTFHDILITNLRCSFLFAPWCFSYCPSNILFVTILLVVNIIVLLRDVFHIVLVIGPRAAVLAWGQYEKHYDIMVSQCSVLFFLCIFT